MTTTTTNNTHALTNALADEIAARVMVAVKEVLSVDEAASYMGMKKSQLYKLTCAKAIPFYKPTGKNLYFNRKEIEAWLQRTRYAADYETKAEAQKRTKGGAA